ncbi:uncharacterized protein PSFLO_06941 [Pseudozyma flocculosa]|uniref:DUF3752 domain-containing protein n=2 Tax=Pseudozyma flocculosa TaxID=84751 RepID=A0A5C3FDM6_9BASI|nr:uncharacterized protein PSFLO_06941 [Pseudozyma flocculosa]
MNSHARPQRTPRDRVVGPSLPPGFHRHASDSRYNSGSDTEDDQDEEAHIGPAPPPDSQYTDEDHLSAAARDFIEREQRRNRAAEEVKLAREKAATSRPDWMLVAPTATSSLSAIAADPTRLKSRGFAQSAPRVQKTRGQYAADGASDATLWNETPEQRVQRLQDEVSGKRARAGAAPTDENEELQRLIQQRRDATIQAQLDRDSSRSASLLDLHKQQRRRELKDKETDGEARRRSPGDAKGSGEEGGKDSRRKHRSSRRRSRSRSPPSRRKREKERDSSRERARPSSSRDRKDGYERDERHRERRERRSDRYELSDRRFRDDAEDSNDESEKRRRRRGKEKEKERTRDRRDKDREGRTSSDRKKASGTTAPVMWDRDAALSVGGKLMDEKSRGRLVQDAAALGSRFGSGSSRFL